MPLTMDNLDVVTESLLEAVRLATDIEDQSLENIGGVAFIFDEIVENNIITPTNTVCCHYVYDVYVYTHAVPSHLHMSDFGIMQFSVNSSNITLLHV